MAAAVPTVQPASRPQTPKRGMSASPSAVPTTPWSRYQPLTAVMLPCERSSVMWYEATLVSTIASAASSSPLGPQKSMKRLGWRNA